MTTLLPPPSTNQGTFRSSHHRRAAATSSARSARINHRAAPPTPSVPSGASATLARAPSASLKRKNRPFLRNQCRQCLMPRADFELDPVAWRQLSGSRKIGRDHRRKLGIAAGGLSIGHQEDRISRGRDLERAGKSHVRNHLVPLDARNRPTRQTVAHSIGLRCDGESRALESLECLGRKTIELRTRKDAQLGAIDTRIRNTDDARRAQRAFIAEWKPVTSNDWPTIDSTKSAVRVSGAAAEYRRHGQSAAERDIRARARPPLAETQHGTWSASDRAMQRDLFGIESGTEVRAGHRNDRAVVDSDFGTG